MDSKLQAFLETEEVKEYFDDNAELLGEAGMYISDFPKVLEPFVLNHLEEFVAENLEQTRRNIRVFSEVATSQFVTELAEIFTEDTDEDDESISESVENDYL